MRSFFALVIVLLALPALALVPVPSASGQESSIEILLRPVDTPTALDEAVLNAFRMSFRSRNVDVGPSLAVLHVSTGTFTTPDGATYGMLSVAESSRLGKSMIDAGAEHEIWYAGKNVTSFTPDAREIRQYMTREVLSDVSQVTVMRSIAFELDSASSAVESYVADYMARHTYRRE